MNRESTPLIVGAGPVGLGTALFLQQAGIRTRIIDMAEQPSPYSRALAVNPRTLELLEPTGVTSRMLALGVRVHGARFRFGAQRTATLSFDSLKHKYPFMLALSQATTERLLTEALEAAGGKVERGTALVACRNAGQGVEAELKHASGESRSSVQCPWLLAADGAHSTARKSLDVNFNGSGFPKPLFLADIPLTTSLEDDLAHAFFPDDSSFLFLIRVVDGTAEESKRPKVWRVISNLPGPVERVPDATPAGAPVWTSEFHVSHRINEHLQVGNVFFAGDAAHIHSPMGARGMNLGLEDAWVFSRLVQLNQMDRYESLRKACDYRVVKQVELNSKVVMSQSALARLARAAFVPLVTKVPFLRARFLATITGLDHSLSLEQPATGQRPESRKHGLTLGKKARQHAH